MNKTEKIYHFICGFIGNGAVISWPLLLFSLFLGLFSDGIISCTTLLLPLRPFFLAILALCDLVLKIKAITSFIARVAIHFVLSAADFAVVLCRLSGKATSGRAIFALTAVFTLLYLCVFVPRCIYLSRKKKKENEEQRYSPVFDKKPE